MSVIRAFLYPFRSRRDTIRFAFLTFFLAFTSVTTYIGLLSLVLLAWVTIIESRTSGQDELPRIRLRHEALIALAAMLLYCISLGLLALPTFFFFQAMPLLIGLVMSGASLFTGLMYLIGLVRYATTGEASAFSDVKENIGYLSQYRAKSIRLIVDLCLYNILITLGAAAVIGAAAALFAKISIGVLLAILILFVVVSGAVASVTTGTGYLLGEWARSMGFSSIKSKRKNEQLAHHLSDDETEDKDTALFEESARYADPIRQRHR